MKNYDKFLVVVVLIVGLSIGQQIESQTKSLINNGSFEDGLRYWSPGVKVVAQIDTNEKYKGNSSLRMNGDPSNAWNVIRSQLVPCFADETYTIQVYCKNAVYPGGIYAGLRWIDSTGSATLKYDWFRLENDTPWELQSFSVAPPVGASQVQVMLRLASDVVGSVWFDEVSLLRGSLKEEFVGAGPMGFRGSIFSMVSYTPEERWIAGHRLQLFTDIAFGTSTKAYVHLGGWLPRPDELWTFDGKGNSNPQLNIKHAYMEIDGPWITGLPSLRTTFGDLMLAYSPYVLQLDRWDLWYWDVMEDPDNVLSYNRIRRGISVESREMEKVYGSSFLLFDGSPDIYAYGGKLRFGNKGTNVTMTAVNFLDNVGVPKDEKPNKNDFTYSLDASMYLGKFKLNAFKACNQKKNSSVLAKEAFANIASLQYQINDYCSLKFDYWSIDSEYDPIYRDRTPQYHPYTGERLAWNPVDRYSGQIGNSISINVINSALSLELRERQAIQYREVEKKINNKDFKLSTDLYNANILVSGEFIETETPQTELGTRNLFIERHFHASGIYPIAKTNTLDVNLEANYRVHEREFRETNKYFIVSSSVKNVPLEGAKFFAGKRYINRPEESLRGLVCGIDFMLAKAIKLSIRYADPKDDKVLNERSRLPMYDQYGDEYIADNIIKLSANLQF